MSDGAKWLDQRAAADHEFSIVDSDLANARRLVDRHGDRMIYTDAAGWFIWDGKRWAADDHAAMKLAKDAVEAIYDELRDINDEARKRLFTWARQSQRADRLRAMLFLAQSEPGMAMAYSDFDADPMLLNVANGTVDLRTGTLHEHRPADRIARIVPVDFDPEASRMMWLEFLDRITDGDRELQAYLQRAAGYSLTGSTGEQVLFFAYGIGANGKTVFMEALKSVLGDYAKAARTETLAVRRGESIPNDIARLAGARLVTVNETAEGQRLNEPLVKDLTGGDTIAARFMRREFFEFRPTFKLWIRGNHKPVIRGTDDGIWRRLHLAPFTVQIPEAERDPNLLQRLLSHELPGILAWAVEGCLAWQRDRLNPPDSVQAATREYRDESDVLAQFIDDECVIQPQATVRAKGLYEAYREWCESTGNRPQSQTAFGRAIAERGFTRRRAMHGYQYEGIAPRSDREA